MENSNVLGAVWFGHFWGGQIFNRENKNQDENNVFLIISGVFIQKREMDNLLEFQLHKSFF